MLRKAPRPQKNPAAMKTRGFPPPWSVEDLGAAFVVKDGARHKLAYVYYEDGPGHEARRNAANIARLPELLRKR
jgi:hypothetical protein